MKRILLLLTFACICLNAQTHRFIYEMKFKLDSASQNLDKINMVLDVNPKDVKYYEYSYLEADSINKKNGNYDYKYGGRFTSLQRKSNSSLNMNYELIGHDMYSFSTEDPINWQLSNEVKKVGDYTLQKATTTFGGRNWIAWFNKDINISEGPYKFRGLPGLIFHLEDTRQNFIFDLVKSENLKNTYDTVGFIETFFGQIPYKTTEKVRIQKQLDMYNDPLKEMRNEFKEDMKGEMIVLGTKITSRDQFKDLTLRAQEMLRKTNNPIELSKAVKYQH